METQGLLDPAPQSWIHSSDLRWFQLCQWRERERNVTAGLRRPRFRTKGVIVHSLQRVVVAFKDSKGLWEEEETLKSTKTSYCSCKGVLVASIAVFLVPSCGEEAMAEEQAVEFRKDSCSLVRDMGIVYRERQEDRIGVRGPAGTVNKGTLILVLCRSC